MAGRLLWCTILMTAATVCVGQTASDGTSFLIDLRSEASLRSVYAELGIPIVAAASERAREDYQRECEIRGTDMGHSPKPIRFLGMASNVDDESKKLRPVCMIVRPYTDRDARTLCERLGRTLLENIPIEMEIRCGPRFEGENPPQS